MRPISVRRSAGLLLSVALIAACTSGGAPTATPVAATASGPPPSATPAAPPTSRPTEHAVAVIEGRFDVGGHKLYLQCQGTGSPTIVYLHGAIWQQMVPHANGMFAVRALRDEVRVCIFDRRNVGQSDTVDAPQRPDDVMRDMRTLLEVAGIEPPYLLLGASFGGLVAYLYANRYPDEVVGMLLLDSMFPDEFTLDAVLEPDDRYIAFDNEDEEQTLERISHYRMLLEAQTYIGHEPAIPVTYLSSIPEGFNQLGVPAYDDVVLDLQRAYVERFSPGRYVRVDSPHFMEKAIPSTIVTELRKLLAAL